MTHRLFTTGSLLLTAALIACGLAFFSPFWLLNLTASEGSFINSSAAYDEDNMNWSGNYSRGLWAQCGINCQWFWQSDFLLQTNLFTPLRWHIATQVLYAAGAGLVLLAEIISRVQMCWTERRASYVTVAVVLIISFVLQLTAVSVFGACSWTAYMARAAPLEHVAWEWTEHVYFGWSYWMSVAGGILSLLSLVFFFTLGCCCRSRWQKYAQN